MPYETIASHRAMALDSVRNDAYAAALSRVVTRDSVVLDLGAGTGVLGLMAARFGARRVYLVEPSDIISVTEEIVAANGLQEQVRCLHGRIEDFELPEPADVIVSVMTGNFLLAEDLLPVLFHARDTVLKPGGRLVPDGAVMKAALVSAADVHAMHVSGWSNLRHGVDLSAARAYAANNVYYGPTLLRESTFLSEPAALLTLDLATCSYDPLHAQIDFEVTESGECHGVAGWFDMRLGDTWLSTSPRSPQTHWSAAYLPLDPPLPLASGDRVSLTLDRVPDGDWSWRIKSPRGSRRHSTLLGTPLVTGKLEKASRNYVPAPTDALAATSFVLASVDGARDVTAVARQLHAMFPSRYATEEEALEFVQRVVAQF
jgi:precorrin-6B methylase 2